MELPPLSLWDRQYLPLSGEVFSNFRSAIEYLQGMHHRAIQFGIGGIEKTRYFGLGVAVVGAMGRFSIVLHRRVLILSRGQFCPLTNLAFWPFLEVHREGKWASENGGAHIVVDILLRRADVCYKMGSSAPFVGDHIILMSDLSQCLSFCCNGLHPIYVIL